MLSGTCFVVRIIPTTLVGLVFTNTFTFLIAKGYLDLPPTHDTAL